jgi:hypothetical protein
MKEFFPARDVAQRHHVRKRARGWKVNAAVGVSIARMVEAHRSRENGRAVEVDIPPTPAQDDGHIVQGERASEQGERSVRRQLLQRLARQRHIRAVALE